MLSIEDNRVAKKELDRIVAVLTELGRRGYRVHEPRAEYGVKVDSDADPELKTEI